MSESLIPDIAPEILRRFNSLMPREARWSYFQKSNGPMFIYNTERIRRFHKTDSGNNMFESAVAVPYGPGSRSNRATNWKILSESRSLHELRRDAKARALRLFKEWETTGKVVV